MCAAEWGQRSEVRLLEFEFHITKLIKSEKAPARKWSQRGRKVNTATFHHNLTSKNITAYITPPDHAKTT